MKMHSMIAAEYGRYEIVKMLIDKNIDLNMRDVDGSTALLLAVENRHTHVARLLIESGADLEICNNAGTNPLMCSFNGDYEIVKLLVSKNVNLDVQQDSFKNTALMRAIGNHHTDIAEHLIINNATIDIQNSEGATALIWSAGSGEERIVKLLIEKGANVDIQDNEGNTAIMCAILKGHRNSIKYMIDANADLNKKNMHIIILR